MLQWISDRKLIFGVGVLVAFLGINAGVNYRNTWQLNEDAAWVAHTHEVLEALEELLGNLKDAETGHRGYLLTGQRQFLEPYSEALGTYKEKIERVEMLTQDDSRQQSRFPRLKELVAAKYAEMARGIALRDAGDAEEALKVVQTTKGKRIMDGIRVLIGEMEAEEEDLLRERQETRKRTYTFTVVSGIAMLVVGLAAVWSILWIGHRSIRDRSRTATALQQKEFLQSTMTSMGDGVIVTDTGGRVTILNPVAEKLTGWTQQEASGQSIEAVLRIINCETRLVVGNPIRRALADGMVVGLEAGTILISNEGTEWPIEDSAAPICDSEGVTTGSVLVFREVSERYRAERALAEISGRRDELLAKLQVSEERFRAFMDHCPANAYMKDREGRLVYVNQPLIRFFDRPVEEWIGKTDHDLFPAEFADEYRRHDEQVLAGDKIEFYTETSPDKDGTLNHWRSYKFPFTDATGRRLLAGMSVNVTAEKNAEMALRSSEAKFRNTMDRLAEGLFVVDVATETFVDANEAILTMLGYSLAEFLALAPFDIVADEPWEEYTGNIGRMRSELAELGRSNIGRKKYRRKDQSVVPVEVRVTVVPNGGAGLHAVIIRDMTEQIENEKRLFEYQAELERANLKLKALASTDGLTGVNNRLAFNEALIAEYGRAIRYEHPLSLILLDVDHFKQFNDAFGHPAGDNVLKAVAATLLETARLSDIVARYGGEEFALILPETDASGAMAFAERCRLAVADVPWRKRPITVSVGVATMTAQTADSAALISEADVALYESKRSGRNRVNLGSGVIPMTL